MIADHHQWIEWLHLCKQARVITNTCQWSPVDIWRMQYYDWMNLQHIAAQIMQGHWRSIR